MSPYTKNDLANSVRDADLPRVKLAKRMSLMFLVVFIFLSFAYYTDSLESFLVMLLGIVLSIISVLSVFKWNNYKVPFYIYAYGGVFVTSFALLAFHNTIHFVDILWILAAVQLGFFGIGIRTGVLLMVMAIISIFTFIFYSLNYHLEAVTIRSFYQEITLVIELASAFLLNLYFVYLYIDEFDFSNSKFKDSVTELWVRNKEIESQNREKSFLIHEVHYRVKDNLEIIEALLLMQKNELNDEKQQLVFQEAINRVNSMALVHERLYKGNKLSNSSMREYLKGLVKEALKINALKQEVKLIVHCNIESFDSKKIVPIGLLLNELTSNSIKHAFDKTIEPNITIELSILDNMAKMVYFDNGSWKEAHNQSSFGMVLIEMLADQLEGEVKIDKRADGTMFLFLFPCNTEVEKIQ